MTVYLDGVILLNFLVDFLLLLGASRLCGQPVKTYRVCGAAAVGGIYAGACLLPGFYFLGNLLWRTVSLGAMAVGDGSPASRRALGCPRDVVGAWTSSPSQA